MSTATAEPTATEPTPQASPVAAMQSPEAKAKARANQPDYGLQKVTTLPDEEPSARGGGRGRSDLYLHLLQPLTQDPGEWYEVALFKTSNGAHQALKAIQEGVKVKDSQGNVTIERRSIPAGDWEMETRRFTVKDEQGNPVLDEKGKPVRHSKLFARFMGNPSATD